MIRSCKFTTQIIIGLLLTTNAFAQKVDLYRSFTSGKMDQWEVAMNAFARKTSLSNQQKLELVSYYYGYIGYSLGVKNRDKAKEYIEKGDAIIDDLIDTYPTAEAYAFKGAFVGFRIGLNPLKAPFLGPSCSKNVDKALSINPSSAQANIEKANLLYYSPSAFGGDKTEAKRYYNRAIALFERNPELTADNWLYLNLLTTVAQINTDEKKYNDAKAMYEKIMKIEPNYLYVKNQLYPQLLKQL